MKQIIKKIKIKGFAILAMMLFSNHLFAQSDNPCGAPALPVNSACSYQSGSNATATTTAGVPAPGCANYQGGDVWYTVTVPANGNITIDMNTGVVTDGGMAIYSGACGSLTLIECDDDDSPNGLMPFISLTGQTPGAVLYVRVWEYGNDNNGSFSICASSPMPITNDECSGAIPLTVNSNQLCSSVTSGSVVGATASPQSSTACGGTENDDVWFSFVATSTDHTISLTNVAGSTTDMYHSVWTGTCPSLTLFPGSCSDPNTSNLTGLTPGTTYYVRVYTWSSSSGATSTFDICIGTPGPPPTNTNCAVPDPICSGSPIVFTAQSNGTAASTVNPGNDYDCLFTSPNPSWYYLEISNGGNLAIDITAGSDIDFELWGPFPSYANAVANCNSYGVPVDCSYSTAAVEQANASGVVAGQVYVLLVTNYANTVQTITVSDAPSNTATTDCTIVPLSVELTAFDGTFNSDMNQIELFWNTAAERNNSHFVLEKSMDTKEWTGVGIASGAGSTNQSTDYRMIDSNPFSGESYYRLKQFDYDGKITISDIISVNRSIENKIKLFPNPTNSAITINSNNKIISVTIVDIQGSSVYNDNHVQNKIAQIDLSNLKDGMYYATIETEQGTSIERISVIK